MLERCRHTGHCFHRDDTGVPFVRHDQNPWGKVALTCCWCERKAEVEGYSKGTKPPAESSYLPREHGLYVGQVVIDDGVELTREDVKRYKAVADAAEAETGLKDPIAVGAWLREAKR